MNTIPIFIAARMRSVMVLSALFALFVVPVCTQNKDMVAKHARVMITTVTIKPEMRTEFENLIKNEYNPAIIKGGAKWSDVWMPAIGNTFDYVFIAPIDGWAQLDGMSPLMKGAGKDGAEGFYAKAGKMVTSVHSSADEFREDLSYEPKMTGPPQIAVVTFTSVAPGRSSEFENFIRNEMLPQIKKSDIGGWFLQKQMFGGDVNEYTTVALHQNFAEIEKGPAAQRVLGEEGYMKLLQKLPSGVVVHQERIVARYAPGLSYRPASSK